MTPREHMREWRELLLALALGQALAWSIVLAGCGGS